VSDARRLTALEDENGKLKKLLAKGSRETARLTAETLARPETL
jgi:hypothetical protein